MKNTFTLLGSGTCRISTERGPVSSCVILGDTTFLIDVGAGALERAERAGAFDHCKNLHIHISHRHTDHLSGLFPLLQSLTWADESRYLNIQSVTVHATAEVVEIIEGIRELWGADETSVRTQFNGCENRELSFRAGPDHNDWTYTVGDLSVKSVHLPGFNNHGTSFELGGKSFALTADATEVTPGLKDFCRDADLCVFDFGHITNVRRPDGSLHIDLQPAVDLLAAANPKLAIAAHIYLRHLQSERLSEAERHKENHRLIQETSERARDAGFTGKLLVATDGMDLMRLSEGAVS